MRVSDISHTEKKRRKKENNTPGAGRTAAPSAVKRKKGKGKKNGWGETLITNVPTLNESVISWGKDAQRECKRTTKVRKPSKIKAFRLRKGSFDNNLITVAWSPFILRIKGFRGKRVILDGLRLERSIFKSPSLWVCSEGLFVVIGGDISLYWACLWAPLP